MVRRSEQSMGAEALLAATGRTREQWRELLIAEGALTWGHGRIAAHLVDTHGVDGWWAQGITVDFEQACQGRLPGQRADGTFAVSRTRTLPVDRLGALASLVAAVTADLGEPSRSNLTARTPVVRWRLADDSRLAATAQPSRTSGTPVNLTWERLPDQDAAAAATARCETLLAAASGPAR